MIKVIGAIFLIAGCVGISLEKIKEDKKEIQNLKEIEKFLSYLYGEIQHSHIPIPDICYEYKNRANGFLKELLDRVCMTYLQNQGSSFDKIWLEEVDILCKNHLELKETKKQLCNLSSCFGFCNINMQISAIDKCSKEVERILTWKEKKFQDNKKIILYFGIMSGLFITILLF